MKFQKISEKELEEIFDRLSETPEKEKVFLFMETLVEKDRFEEKIPTLNLVVRVLKAKTKEDFLLKIKEKFEVAHRMVGDENKHIPRLFSLSHVREIFPSWEA